MSSSNSVESLSKALEVEKIVSRLAIAENDAMLTRLRKEKQTRIVAEVKRDALRLMGAITNAKKDTALSNLSREKEMRIGAEIERDALRAMRATANAEKDVTLSNLIWEKEMRIGVKIERDAIRVMMATSENEKLVLLGMNAIAEAERDALRGRLLIEWIDGQTLPSLTSFVRLSPINRRCSSRRRPPLFNLPPLRLLLSLALSSRSLSLTVI
ncbi:hypothetical protein LWI29_038165 [Acer saccharum]|uniref:Uncharacterized protein n=1 Tax=Acer saccharum TaxID=4024 RepID=A0AA39S6L2_ACESA|nr:hypothetical protein LWI29_038165 [Acer saccharum]